MSRSQDIPVFPLIPRKRVPFGVAFGRFISQRRGVGYDYRGPRHWEPGDDMHQLDHKTTMRQSAFKQSFDPWIREHHADVSLRAVVIVDRSPRMQRYPIWSPWLKKPEAIVRVGSVVVASAKHAGAFVGYLDFADWAKDQEPFWRPPNQETEAAKIIEKYLPHKHFTAPNTTLNDAFLFLLGLSRDLPQESFVFVLSDFLAIPDRELFQEVVNRWDTIPVVIQDPVLEASFPVWKEGIMPIPAFLPGSPKTARGSRKQRQEHEQRLAAIREMFYELGLVPVFVNDVTHEHILQRFFVHVDERNAIRR